MFMFGGGPGGWAACSCSAPGRRHQGGEAAPGSRNASESAEAGASGSRPGPSPSLDQSAGALP